MSLLKFSVEGSSLNETKFVAKARNFELVIDEPPSLGGNDEGANPVEYLLASFAGCLNVVGFLVAKEHGLKLKNLNIKIEGDLNPAKFLGQGDDERAGYQHIQIFLDPDIEADEQTIHAWAEEVERRCPINDNLGNKTPIFMNIENIRSKENLSLN
ncbi:MAG: OsmC family protein [Bacteroidia bacterium]|nr:OsmC family protein [Bacteroidia bacterium]